MMFLQRFYNSLSKDKKEDFVLGLVGGLVWGLVGGLVLGLVWGLVWGLVGGLVGGFVGGLVWGLVGGLVVGLVGGLVVGLVWGLVVGQYGLSNIFILILGIIVFIIMELMYYFSNKDNKKKISLLQVLWLKIKELFEILVVVINILNLWFLSKQIIWKQEYNDLGIFASIIALFIGYLWINRYLITNNKRK